MSGGLLWRGQNSQQALHVFGGIPAEAGQVASVWLGDQGFVEQAPGRGDGSGCGSLMNFEAFLELSRLKSARISSSATNSGVYDIRTPDFLGIVRR